MGTDSAEIPSEFEDHEVLLRAVWPIDKKPNFWEKQFFISPVALEDKGGLSVCRSNNHSIDDVKRHMYCKNLHGIAVSISVPDCREANAVLRYLPSSVDELHSEIHGSEESPLLSYKQRVLLAERAEFCGEIKS